MIGSILYSVIMGGGTVIRHPGSTEQRPLRIKILNRLMPHKCVQISATVTCQ